MESKGWPVGSRPEDLTVEKVLKERSERFRIENSLFEDNPSSQNGETSSENTLLRGLTLEEVTQSIEFNCRGVDVFEKSCVGNIFDDALLHKNLCESKPSHMINHPLFHISSEALHEVIRRGLLKQPLKNQVVYSHLNKYLFFLISCHSSMHLVTASYRTLKYNILNCSTEKSSPWWMPSIEDILMVFSNYGASKELLGSWDTPLPKRELSNETKEELIPDPRMKNLPLVLKVISVLLMKNEGKHYTDNELDKLLCIILTVSVDKFFMSLNSIRQEISNCIKCILTAYPSSAWEKKGKVSELSKVIYKKFCNVPLSDIYFIINSHILCPGFGQKLSLSIMYTFICQTLPNNNATAYMDDVKLEYINKIFNVNSLLEMDSQTQYHVLLMIECLVTRLIHTLKDLKELKRLTQLVLNVRIMPPYSDDMIDYLLVKELITRAATTWKLHISELT